MYTKNNRQSKNTKMHEKETKSKIYKAKTKISKRENQNGEPRSDK